MSKVVSVELYRDDTLRGVMRRDRLSLGGQAPPSLDWVRLPGWAPAV